MLIGTRAFSLSQIDRMRVLSDDIGDRQTAIATSKRWQTASDDPSASQQSVALTRRQADNARYGANLDFAEQRLTVADEALGNFANRMIRLKELAVQAGSETIGASGRQILATEAREILRVMVSLGNSQDATGNYLFAGARAGDTPFAFDAAGVVEYRGLGVAAPVAVGPDAELETTEPGDALFGEIRAGGAVRTVFQVVEDFITALEAPAPDPSDDPALAARRAEFDLAIEGTQAAIDRLATVRATFGGRLNRVEAERDSLASGGDALTAARSRLEDTDLAAEITLLQRASLVLQATQRSFAQVSGLSLFNELR